jgi:hypothetical protein
VVKEHISFDFTEVAGKRSFIDDEAERVEWVEQLALA